MINLIENVIFPIVSVKITDNKIKFIVTNRRNKSSDVDNFDKINSTKNYEIINNKN